ncbi:MAG: glycosyltransferase family A protein [Cyanobacteria bacterium J06597_1]
MQIDVLTIAVVITCYSEGDLILEAIQSVRQQSFSANEIILVNDCSSDPLTNSICHSVEQDDDIHIIWCSTNGGPSRARNIGFRYATSEIIVPLDADDLLPSDALELLANAFDRKSNPGFVYGSYLRSDLANAKPKKIFPGDISLQKMLRSKPFSTSTNWKLLGTTPFRRSILQSTGYYDINFGVDSLHDVEFWIRILASDCSYTSIDSPIYIWRKYLGSNSKQVTPVAWSELAHKHFDIYTEIGLQHRAYELMLLGSKWSKDRISSRIYSSSLLRLLLNRKAPISALLSLIIPTNIVRPLSAFIQKWR